jgi:hypothetical protein
MSIKLLVMMMLNLLFIARLSLAMSVSDFKAQVDSLRTNLDRVLIEANECVAIGNVVCMEWILLQLIGVNYEQLLTMRANYKEQLIIDFAEHFGRASSTFPAAVSLDGFGAIAASRAIANGLLIAEQNYGILGNLANLEYFLQVILLQDYRNLIGQLLRDKLDRAYHALIKLGVDLRFEAKAPVDWSNYEDSYGSAAGKADEPAVTAGVSSLANDDHWGAGLKLSEINNNHGPFNKVNLHDYPMVGKYFGDRGYPMATVSLVIKNNLVSSKCLDLMPDNIKLQVNDCEIDFYTEILAWKNEFEYLLDRTLVPFDANDRYFNLVFHGTMLSWFANKYKDYDFKTQAISENLLMGIFNFDGIPAVLGMGNNQLELQSVNPHDNHFSPDNAKFKVSDDRNLVTFWSVAKSTDQNRAVVTYHVLVNSGVYENQTEIIAEACSHTNTLRQFMEMIKQVEAFGGFFSAQDHVAWQAALRQLQELYGAIMRI